KLHCIAERFALDPRVLGRIRKIVASTNPDILQTHSVKSHFLIRTSGECFRRPWIAFHHGYTMTVARERLYKQLDRWSLRRPDKVVTVSSAFQQQLIRSAVPPERIVVLHNAIDPMWGARVRHPELRRLSRQALGIREADRVLLIVGRLSSEKNHALLVRAVA